LFLGYTFTDTRLIENGTNTENPLTPKHRRANHQAIHPIRRAGAGF
jgi:hypothetical protein